MNIPMTLRAVRNALRSKYATRYKFEAQICSFNEGHGLKIKDAQTQEERWWLDARGPFAKWKTGDSSPKFYQEALEDISVGWAYINAWNSPVTIVRYTPFPEDHLLYFQSLGLHDVRADHWYCKFKIFPGGICSFLVSIDEKKTVIVNMDAVKNVKDRSEIIDIRDEMNMALRLKEKIERYLGGN